MRDEIQEDVRTVLRKHCSIPEDQLRRPIHLVSLHRTSSVSLSIGELRKQYAESEQCWAIDLGHSQHRLSSGQERLIARDFDDRGIPYWRRRVARHAQALRWPDALSGSYGEVCEAFGHPTRGG